MQKDIGQTIAKHQIRYDLEIIASLIKDGSSVLDIGCGDGELLEFLVKNKKAKARGIEISGRQVSKALLHGLSVIQGNAEEDLQSYPDKSFDYAILSHTIQATHRPDQILREMLRIANYAIVSLPNFANIKNRLHLAFKGTMPVNKTIPFEWYETPNIHFCSIKDFRKLCKDLRINIKKEVFLTNNNIINHNFIVNLFAEYAIFLIVKDEFSVAKEFEFVKKTRSIFAQKTSFQPI
ncbi:MAG TPA: methionine biosynthesis protein MetW [Rickettsiales bacterium]|nr:methionine biosynthesis protein MetW [Rickettsiales bacterium]